LKVPTGLLEKQSVEEILRVMNSVLV